MYDSQMTERAAGTLQPTHLEMRWLPVIDERGVTRMQAVWIDAAASAAVVAHHAA